MNFILLQHYVKVNRYINETKRRAENLLEVVNIQQAMSNLSFNLVEPFRLLIRRGFLVIQSADLNIFDTFYCFLFNDIFVFTTIQSNVHMNTSKLQYSMRSGQIQTEPDKYLFCGFLALERCYLLNETSTTKAEETQNSHINSVKIDETQKYLNICLKMF